MSETSDVRG